MLTTVRSAVAVFLARGRMTVWLVVATVCVAVAVVAVVVWAPWQRPVATPPPHARHYLNASACLLTDPHGITAGSAAAPVWATMRSASLTTHVMVSYLSATGPADLTPMLNTLVQRHCGVIIATSVATDEIVVTAKTHPQQQFLLVSAAPVAAAPPDVVVSGPDAAPARIAAVIDTVAAHATGS